MEEESRIRKIIDAIFIQKPVGFLAFLVLGVVLFLYAAWEIKVPMYSAAETAEGTEWEYASEKSLLEHIFIDGGNMQ